MMEKAGDVDSAFYKTKVIGLSFGICCGSVAIEIVTQILTPDTAFKQNTEQIHGKELMHTLLIPLDRVFSPHFSMARGCFQC